VERKCETDEILIFFEKDRSGEIRDTRARGRRRRSGAINNEGVKVR
jgi:hypothetical protein